MNDLRALWREGISAFLDENSRHIMGRTLDYGCGTQPYRSIIEAAAAEYVGYDRSFYNGAIEGVGEVGDDEPLLYRWDTIVCTQVLEVVADPRILLKQFQRALTPEGVLLLTAATAWPALDRDQFWRWTIPGMVLDLERADFTVEEANYLAYKGQFEIGFGVRARA